MSAFNAINDMIMIIAVKIKTMFVYIKYEWLLMKKPLEVY